MAPSLRRRGRALVPLLLVTAVLLPACDSDNGLRRLNFGRTALITGDFDTVEQLIVEVANTTTVSWELQRYDGYIGGPSFETPLDYGAGDLSLQVEDLLRADVSAGLSQFKTVFLSCGMRGVGDHIYNGVQEDNQLVLDGTVIDNVREAVFQGGRLYFSDWTYDLLEAAWPDKIRFVAEDSGDLDAAQRGRHGVIAARIVNSDLASFMEVDPGTEIEIEFNQGGWAVIDSVADDVDVLVEGDIEYDDPDSAEVISRAGVPLVVAFDSGGGKVVFTSFHNEAQITDDARDVLRYQLTQLSQ